ncbi:MAG: hypothetical protein ACTSU5_03550 [Promethearchaeota archaeon]
MQASSADRHHPRPCSGLGELGGGCLAKGRQANFRRRRESSTELPFSLL